MRLLPIRALEIHGEDGGVRVIRTVWCPSCARSHRIDELAGCGSCVPPDPRDRDSDTILYLPDENRPPARLGFHSEHPEPTDDPISAVMTSRVIAVREHVPLRAATDLIVGRQIGALPVVDEDGHPLGVLSKTDLLSRKPDPELSISGAGVLAVAPRILPEDAPIWEAAAVMASEGVHRVLVVAAGGRLAGIASALDIVRWMARREGWPVLASPIAKAL